MTYHVLARRTRPQTLHELVGQDSVQNALKGMLESQKIPHAFLFTGTRGTGKTSTARILAKSLNCEQGVTISPCQICRHCKQITACSHEDVFEMDAASHTGVDNIRELRESAQFYPVSARHKIFIIDEVHMLSNGAFNALLKTLEEPPPKVIFILATTEFHKIPVTVRSRCLTFTFKKVDHLSIFEHLKKILLSEKIECEENALKLISREAQGSLRDSLSLLEQALALRTGTMLTAQETKQSLGLQNEEVAFEIFSSICSFNQVRALEILKQSDDSGCDLSLLIECVANYFRFALLLRASNHSSACATLLEEEKKNIQQISKHMNVSALGEIFKLLSSGVKDIRGTANALAFAEVVVMDAVNRSDWLSASETLLKVQNTLGPAVKPRGDVDLNLYKRFVEAAKKRSQTLAARLNFVQLEIFNQSTIKFANTPENAAYLSFDVKDKQHFLESLAEMGLEHAWNQEKHSKESFTSLNEIKDAEKKKDFALKEKEIMSKESVKNLMLIAKEIQLTPREN